MAPLIVITGPTGSGKSSLALDLAERYHGEIICADSRTVYKGMDIGTAKPSAEDQARVPHHLIDVVKLDERYTLHDFQQQAFKAIADIRQRGRVPFLVGGTGLYIDSVVLNYQLDGEVDPKKRALLESKSIIELQSMIKEQRLELPVNSLNKRHLIRVLEQGKVNRTSLDTPEDGTYVVAIQTETDELRERIRQRADEMFEDGVLEEAEGLAATYGWESEAMTGNIYPILHELIEGTMSVEQAKQAFIASDMRLVKRQLTWLRRRDYTQWLTLDEARVQIEAILRRWTEENVLV